MSNQQQQQHSPRRQQNADDDDLQQQMNIYDLPTDESRTYSADLDSSFTVQQQQQQQQNNQQSLNIQQQQVSANKAQSKKQNVLRVGAIHNIELVLQDGIDSHYDAMHTIGTNDKSEESRDSAKTASTGCNDVFDSPPSASLVPTQSDKRRTNYRDTAQNLFKAYVGSGILALPYAFARAGYLLSTFVFLGIAYIVYDCFRLMFKIVDTYEKKDIDFSQIVEINFGARVAIVSNFFEHSFDTPNQIGYQLLYLLLAVAVVSPMIIINDIALFAKITFIGNILATLTFVFVFAFNFYEIFTSERVVQNAHDLAHITQVPLLVGVSIYAFESIGLVFNIRNSMQDTEQFQGLYRKTTISVWFLYLAFGVLGVLANADKMEEIYLFSLPSTALPLFFTVLYAFSMMISFPLQLLPTFHIIENVERVKEFIGEDSNQELKKRRWGIRGMIVIILGLVAFAIPRFAILINLVGAIGGSAIQFVFPILIYNRIFSDSIVKSEKIKNWSYLGIGVFSGLMSVIYTFVELLDINYN